MQTITLEATQMPVFATGELTYYGQGGGVDQPTPPADDDDDEAEEETEEK